MIKEFFATQENMGVYGSISIIMFLIAFGIAAVRAFYLNKDFAEEMAGMACDENEESTHE